MVPEVAATRNGAHYMRREGPVLGLHMQFKDLGAIWSRPARARLCSRVSYAIVYARRRVATCWFPRSSAKASAVLPAVLVKLRFAPHASNTSITSR